VTATAAIPGVARGLDVDDRVADVDGLVRCRTQAVHGEEQRLWIRLVHDGVLHRH
jgi:hypothetical protein